jgi:hypothetical protein
MPSVSADHGVIHLGLDVHKNTISAGILEADAETAVVDKISSDEGRGTSPDRPVRPAAAGAGLLRGRSHRV